MADLCGVKLKLSRARDHLDAVDDEVVRFATSGPYEAEGSFDHRNVAYFVDPQPGYVVRLRQTKPLHTDQLSLLIGDCVHNVRSALDHLAWQLVLANAGTPGRNTTFPIYESASTDSGKKRSINVAGGVHPTALELIKGLQPFAGNGDPRVHPLTLIHDLDRYDKHRTLQAVGLSVVQVNVSLIPPTENARFAQFREGEFRADEPIAFFPFGENQGEMEFHGHFKALVTLADVPTALARESVTDLLDRLIRYVQTEVVAPLGRYVE